MHVCRVPTARLDAKIDGHFSTMWRLRLEGYWCVWSSDLEENLWRDNRVLCGSLFEMRDKCVGCL